MLTWLLIGPAIAAPPPLPSIELTAGLGYGATGGTVETGLLADEEDPVLQVMGPSVDARASLALKRGRWWQFQGVVNGWWVFLPTERLNGERQLAATEDALFLAQIHAGPALAVHLGPRIRINGGVGLVGQKFRTTTSPVDYTRLGVGWEFNATWTWDLGRKWAVGLGIGTTGHAIPRTGPDKNLFSGGEAGLRLTFIQDGMKEVWLTPKERLEVRSEQRKQGKEGQEVEEREVEEQPSIEPSPPADEDGGIEI
jgi:hypothetical protein